MDIRVELLSRLLWILAATNGNTVYQSKTVTGINKRMES